MPLSILDPKNTHPNNATIKLLVDKINELVKFINNLSYVVFRGINRTEAITYTLITNGVNTNVNGKVYDIGVVYSVALPPLVKAGSTLVVTSIFEITNDQNYNLAVGRFIKLGTSATDNSFDVTKYIAVPDEDNCTPSNHHWVVTIPVGNYTVTSDIVNGYVNVCTYGVSSSAQNGQVMFVETGYGHLDVTVYSTP